MGQDAWLDKATIAQSRIGNRFVMSSLLDTQTNSLSSTEVSVGYIDNYAQNSGTTSTQLKDLGTQESADLQLSPSDIWLTAPTQLDLAPDYNLLSATTTNNDVLYQPSAELAAQGVTYDSSPTLSVLAASGAQADLSLKTWDQNSAPIQGTSVNYSIASDGTLQTTGQSLSSSSSGIFVSRTGTDSSLYLANTGSGTISTPFSLTGSGSTSDTSTQDNGSSPGTTTSTNSGNTPTTSTDTGSTPTTSTDTGSTPTTSTDTQLTSNSTASSTSIDFGRTTSSSLTTLSTSSSDPVPVPFEMHSTIGLLIVSFILAKRFFHQQKEKKLTSICYANQ